MNTLYLILYILAFVSFVLAAFGGIASGKVNLIALGLAFLVMVFVIQAVKLVT